nr:hypothetical protein [Kibdelosporangium sp. MJ126-NF4]CTQ92484.1 hypothetical protein [Kibdelosporangium sp. MJ126-NF4]
MPEANAVEQREYVCPELPQNGRSTRAVHRAAGVVILTEFFRDRQAPYFTDYVYCGQA